MLGLSLGKAQGYVGQVGASSALQDQVTLQAPILRNRLRDRTGASPHQKLLGPTLLYLCVRCARPSDVTTNNTGCPTQLFEKKLMPL